MHRDRDSRRLILLARQVEQRAHLLFALYAKRIGIRAELAAFAPLELRFLLLANRSLGYSELDTDNRQRGSSVHFDAKKRVFHLFSGRFNCLQHACK